MVQCFSNVAALRFDARGDRQKRRSAMLGRSNIAWVRAKAMRRCLAFEFAVGRDVHDAQACYDLAMRRAPVTVFFAST